MTIHTRFLSKGRACKILLCNMFIFAVLLLTACSMSEDRKSVSLGLKVNGKTYLFSNLETFLTKDFLNKNESPPINKSTKLVADDGKLYIEPSELESIVALLSGNYVLLDYQEKSYDGYVTKGEYEVFDKKYNNESTEKIGDMISVANVSITDTNHTKEFKISWQRSPHQKPLENCTEMSLWTDRTYKPGEKTLAKSDYIMVDLGPIAAFYGSKVSLDYVAEDEILYVVIE